MIKKRNLDSSLIQWIMTVTGLGPGVGELVWVAPAASSSSQFRTQLESNQGIEEDIQTTATAAYAKLVNHRNDVMLVMPGAYDEAASIDWAKDNTHLIGLGGPNTRADYSEKNVVIYTDTAAVDYTIHLTGDHCIFKNIGINNAGANEGNFSPLYVNGYGNYFENVGLIGNMTAQQLADDDCASLHIGTNAHNCKWINCDIGEDCWGARSAAYSGQVSFIGSNPNGGLFQDCYFRSSSVTATVAMITVYKGAAGTTHIGRGWVWKNCVFHNWGGSNAGSPTTLNQVFELDATSGHGTTYPILLHNCSAIGFDEWTDNDSPVKVYGTMPEAVDGGGLVKQLTDTVA